RDKPIAPRARDDLPADDVGDDRAERQRRDDRPRTGRRLTQHALHVERQIDAQTQHQRPDEEAGQECRREDLVAKEVKRQQRLGHPRFHHRERDGHDQRDRQRPDDLRRTPRIARSGPGQPDQQRHNRRDDGGYTDPVNPPPATPRAGGWEANQQRDQGNRADGQVDVEDPAPAQIIGDPAAEAGAKDRGQPEGRRDDALPAPALLRREEVADARKRARLQRARANALQAPEDDQFIHRRGAARERRGQHEDDHTEDQNRLAPELVGELARDGNDTGRRQQIRRNHPGVAVEAVEFGDDARQRRADDGLVKRR